LADEAGAYFSLQVGVDNIAVVVLRPVRRSVAALHEIQNRERSERGLLSSQMIELKQSLAY